MLASRFPARPSQWPPRFIDALRLLALLGAASMTSACGWLMGGIPNEPDELEDGSALPADDDAASVGDASSARDAAGPGPVSDAAPRVDASGGPGPDRDGGTTVEPKDAGPGNQPPPGDDRDAAASGDSDSGAASAPDAGNGAPADAAIDAEVAGEEPVVDSGSPPPSCTAPVDWYPDKDKDGYGDDNASPTPGCMPPDPTGKWASRAGDCEDELPKVHLEQQDYFDAPYRASSGADSYDYDCSGVEDGTGGQKEAADGCGLLGLAACDQGSGYAKTTRSGVGVNQYCGSKLNNVCSAGLLGALVCTLEQQPISDAYRCK